MKKGTTFYIKNIFSNRIAVSNYNKSVAVGFDEDAYFTMINDQ